MTGSPHTNRGPSAAASNRSALIRAARTQFADAGLDVPLSAIARAAGVGQGVLYRHFPTRDDLAMAVFDENFAEVEALAADPDVNLKELLTFIVDQLTDSAAFIVMLDPVSTNDERLAETAARMLALITTKLDDPHQRGPIRGSMTASDIIMALAMLAAVLVKTEPRDRKAVGQHAWKLLAHGLFQ
ncbi:TetR/AcrR family transcriptional regulator [Nocardia niigatensis]|uniref:TetR/AcrR family transcriptional regulator n=1 Tax=Nocardia niigatensis TaxID=209249 RepID=UPI0005943C61|nr:TetR/AcrR family transcriptional regulator [Nocardia niigatensis]